MKHATPVLVFSLLILYVSVAQAQVEVIDPNPTMPRDIGGRLTYHGYSDSGFRLGRAAPREENPAETLLKSIEGTNYGRYTGHSLFSRSVAPRTSNNVSRRRVSNDNPAAATSYARRGAYEGRVYQQPRDGYRASQRKGSDLKKSPARRPAQTRRNVERGVESPKGIGNGAPRTGDN